MNLDHDGSCVFRPERNVLTIVLPDHEQYGLCTRALNILQKKFR